MNKSIKYKAQSTECNNTHAEKCHILDFIWNHHHHHQCFFWDYSGEPVLEENLLDFYCAREDNRDRHTNHPDGCHSIQTNHRPTSIVPPFLRWMPFLPHPSHFILAWDRHQIYWFAYPMAWFRTSSGKWLWNSVWERQMKMSHLRLPVLWVQHLRNQRHSLLKRLRSGHRKHETAHPATVPDWNVGHRVHSTGNHRVTVARRQQPQTCHQKYNWLSLLWSPCGVGQTIIFSSCGFFFLSIYLFFLA